jgi:hypothetical protein
MGTVNAPKSLAHILTLLIAISFSLVFFNSPGTHDVTVFLQDWLPNYQRYGFVEGYSVTADNYPPLSYVVIGLVGELAARSHVETLVVFKTVLFVFLALTTLAFYYTTRNIMLSAALHIALTVNSMALGYLDILFAPTILMCLFYLRNRNILLSTISFLLGGLMKFQPWVIAPFILVYVVGLNRAGTSIRLRATFRSVLLPVIVGLGITAIVFGPFTLVRAMHPDSHLTGNAFNANWVLGTMIRVLDPGRYQAISNIGFTEHPEVSVPTTAISLVLYGYLLLRFHRIKEKAFADLLVYATLGFLAFFMFSVSVHENHLFIVPLCLFVLLFIDRKYSVECSFWTIFANLNLVALYGLDGSGLTFNLEPLGRQVLDYVSAIIAATGVIMFLRLFVMTLRSQSRFNTHSGSSLDGPSQRLGKSAGGCQRHDVVS